jgi:hypothetical protein
MVNVRAAGSFDYSEERGQPPSSFILIWGLGYVDKVKPVHEVAANLNKKSIYRQFAWSSREARSTTQHRMS